MGGKGQGIPGAEITSAEALRQENVGTLGKPEGKELWRGLPSIRESTKAQREEVLQGPEAERGPLTPRSVLSRFSRKPARSQVRLLILLPLLSFFLFF